MTFVLYEARKAVSLLLQGNPNIMSMLWIEKRHRLIEEDSAQLLIDNRHLFLGKHVYNAFSGYAHQQMEKMETREPGELREYLAVTAELKFRGCHPNHKGETFSEPERDTGELRDAANWNKEKLLQRLTHFQKKGENIGYMGEKRKQLVLRNGYDTKNAAHLIRLLRMCVEFLKTGEMIVFRPDAEQLLEIKTGKWKLDEVKALADDLWKQARDARDSSKLPDEPNREAAEKILIQIAKIAIQELTKGN